MSRPYKTNGEILAGDSLPDGLRRVAAIVEYNGAAYHGFQVQSHDPCTVQAQLHQAFSAIAAEPITVVCAGRTDAGVHASNQVVHFDTCARRPSKAWLEGANTQLPRDIRIRWAGEVRPQFHARFSAQARSYRYLLSDQKVRPGLLHKQLSWSRWPLDVAAMARGAGLLLGEHDFSSFRAAQCQAASPVRRIETIDLYRLDTGLIVIEIKANAFLHHMVRNIVGVLMAVGAGRQSPGWVAQVLAARDRSAAEVTAPADGLYFVAAHYPESLAPPAQGLGPLLLPDSLERLGQRYPALPGSDKQQD
ncbi:MAG: tRNA pseudouridine(38-40) synthase TruA [Cellvibrionaceae bacterium]|nr:tRNA pseudouridine(38-40) synthase TruA [Cellvibrionaceae bacterium]